MSVVISTLYCPRCVQDVPQDHWAVDRCTAFPAAFIDWLVADLTGDNRPEGWTTTQILGCVREQAILKYLPVRINPAHYLSIFTGQAAHGVLQAGRREARVHGVLGGVRISGEPDLLGGSVVADYKWTGSLAFLKAARPDSIVQLSIYGELLRQNGKPAVSGLLYYGGFGKAMKDYAFPLLGVPEILAHPVDETGRTVRDNLVLIDWLDGQADKVTAIGELPLTGRDIHFGKESKCSGYCPVEAECTRMTGETW